MKRLASIIVGVLIVFGAISLFRLYQDFVSNSYGGG